jgi:hypothetical protein
MHRVGTLFQFIGGSITRVAFSAVLIGTFFVLMGVTPWQYVVELITKPPAWMASPWFRLSILVLGLAIIWFSFNFNRWSVKQEIIDRLALDIAWAIDHLLNRQLPGNTESETDFIDRWNKDYKSWCDRVSGNFATGRSLPLQISFTLTI